jgi:hypothetical protein
MRAQGPQVFQTRNNLAVSGNSTVHSVSLQMMIHSLLDWMSLDFVPSTMEKCIPKCVVSTQQKKATRVCFKCVKYCYETVIVPAALGLKNNIYCVIITADIHKITNFVFPQTYINN